jgi:myo-inositol 2-dehydrogenase/D-chiro-inositol 1-dehydrogenase
MANGAVVDVEASINIQFGYDIRGEIVGERGTVELAETAPVVVKREGRYGGRVPDDWRERFVRAYDVELQEWVNAASAGRSTGPSSWDGYASIVACDAALQALGSGERVEVSLREQPDLYRSGGATGMGPTGTD